MADSTPKAFSFEQLLEEALATYLSETGVNDLNEGGISVGLFEANAQTTYRAMAALFQVLRDRSIDRATGDTLKRIAAEEGIKPFPAGPSFGSVDIGDSSFTKKASKIYAGAKAINVGTTVIPVSDTTDWPSTGNIYIGRGTPNVEGPLPYTSITPSGGFFNVNLSSPTSKFHNVSETVILAQGGNRTVAANTVVTAPSAGGADDVNFATNDSVVLLDGENLVQNILATAQLPGTQGNVTRGAIRAFANPPFSGATVTNPKRFNTGRNQETDDQLRARVKRVRLSRGLGTNEAVKNSVYQASAPDEESIVSSNSLVTSGGKTTLYIDDGGGYERKTAGVGLEFIVDSALGGETDFQLATGGTQAGVAKAFLLSGNSAPFVLAGGERLSVLVGGVLYEHTFAASDFQAPGAATAFEIVASINGNPALGFNAATSGNGTRFYIIAKGETFEHLQVSEPVSGTDASPLIGFQSNQVDTLRLYKNNQALSKDGIAAFLISEDQSEWSPTIQNGDTLIIEVDGTAAITYTFTNQDFVEEGTFSTVASTNSLSAWINVLNAKLTGVTASIQGQAIKLTSNLGIDDRAQLVISQASTLVSKGMFSTVMGLSATGKKQDYEFSRNTGQIKLLVPLSEGDSLTAGSSNTAASVVGDEIVGSTAVFPANGYFWALIDDPLAETIVTQVASGTLLSISKPAANTVRYTSNIANAFDNVVVGDYVIIWSQELSADNRLEGRVNAKTSTTMDLVVTAAEYAAADIETNVVFQKGFTVVRTSEVPQRVKINAGTYNINELAASISAQLVGGICDVQEDLRLELKTDNLEEGKGSVLIAALDSNAVSTGFTEGSSDLSRVSHTATYESGASLGDYPSFVHGKFTSEDADTPPDSYVSPLSTTPDLRTLGFNPNKLVKFLNKYGAPMDALSAPNQVVQANDIGFSTVDLEQSQFVKRLRINDRFYLAETLNFGANDQMIVILDGNASEKTFVVPLYRRAITNTTAALNNTTFNAYDVDSGSTTEFSQFFGSGFKFDNYQALMRARMVLKQATVSQTAILYRAAVWGRAGERYKIGYGYPTSANQDISHVITTDSATDIKILLKSGDPVVTQHNGSTQWDITIVPNTPVAGVDQVTYAWTGVGANPNLTGLSGGEYVTVGTDSQFDPKNCGTFRISTEAGFLPTATSFTVQRKNGAAVAQQDVLTLVTNSLQFFEESATTAAEIQAYVAATLGNWITATIVNDGGVTGSGVISLSTHEDTFFVSDALSLADGINWIASTSLGASPQFAFKRSLNNASMTGYAFNAGEEIRLTPTTMEQAAEFLNVLAVTGLSTLASIKTSQRDRKLQITTSVLGSGGSVQVIGGQASVQSAQVLGSAFTVDGTFSKALALRSQASGMMAEQLVKLQAENFQRKAAGISSTTSARIRPNYPANGKTAIEIGNRQIGERFFGSTRKRLALDANNWRIEKHGKFVCITWTGTGSTPALNHLANFRSSGGGSLTVYKVPGTSYADINITSGTATFADVNIGDRMTFANMVNNANNGTFEIAGKSTDNKTVRILNSAAVSSTVTSTITITDNANLTGDSFTVNGVTKAQGADWAVGADAIATAANLAASLSTISGIQAEAVANTVNLSATYQGTPIAVVYNDTGAAGATILHNPMFGESYADGDFTATVGIQEGDTVLLRNEWNVLNRGKFRVIRLYANSFWIENDSAVEEEIAVSNTAISTVGGDGTTELAITQVNNANMKVEWTGTGTEPDFSVLRPGDLATFGGSFNVLNQGQFEVCFAVPKTKEITDFVFPAASDITGGQFFTIKNALDAISYYVWFKVDGVGADPAPGGTGILVSVASGDSSSVVASSAASAIGAVAASFTAVATGSSVRVTNVGFGPTTSATVGTMPAGFSATVYQEGQRSSMQVYNKFATSETVTAMPTLEQASMLFYEYDAACAGDTIGITADVLNVANRGAYTITDVLDPNTVVIDATKTLVDFLTLGAASEGLYLQEGVKYSGYKTIYNVTIEPSNENQIALIFDSRWQVDKINDSGAVTITGLGKLDFPTSIKSGLDSYRYDTGLLAEANRIVYGDPRDNTTYPGVAAAGAEIYIDPPFFRRVQVGIAVRLLTGVPFSQITEQVRNAVQSLIDSSDIGKSIPISSIVSAVNSIPGVFAVAISSPLYNATNDVIQIQPSEKPLIVDQTADISVSQIGA
jgi:hypothetical protein